VSKRFSNIEDFVREKLGFLDAAPTNDWEAFQRKLKRALLIRRFKRATGVIGLLLLLFSGQQFYGHFTDSSFFARRTSETNRLTKQVAYTNSHYSASANSAYSSNVAAVKASSNEGQLQNSPKKAKQVLAIPVPTESAKPELQKTNSFKKTPKPGVKTASLAESLIVFTHQDEVVNISSTNLALIDDLLKDYRSPLLNTEKIILSEHKRFYSVANNKETYISPLQEKDPWSYSLNIYPNFAFRKFKVDANKRARLHSDFIDAMLSSTESSGLNLNLGFEVNKRIGIITYVNTGVEYIRNSYLADFDFVNFRNANIDNSTGEITSYSMRQDPNRIVFSNQNSFHYLNLPLSISHQPWASEKVRINLELGFSLLYFLKAQGATIDYRSLEIIDLAERNYRKFMGSSSLKIGLQYYVSKTLNIGLEPTLMYFTNSIYTEEYPFQVIPYSVGLNVNIQMKL
jgi:hypothetical protein